MSSFGDKAPVLIQTKLAPPTLGRDLVARPYLVDRLNRGMDRKLTLISAMAGAGKSTLMTQWLLEHKQQTAWLSLDQEDNQMLLFVGYLCSAIQTVFPENCGEVLDFLEAQMALPPRVITTSLVNELNSLFTSAKSTEAELHALVFEAKGALPRLETELRNRDEYIATLWDELEAWKTRAADAEHLRETEQGLRAEPIEAEKRDDAPDASAADAARMAVLEAEIAVRDREMAELEQRLEDQAQHRLKLEASR